MMIKEPGQTVKRWSSLLKTSQHSSHPLIPGSQFNGIPRRVQGRTIRIQGLLAHGGNQNAVPNAHSQRTIEEVFFHVPQNVRQAISGFQKSLKLVAQSDDKLGKDVRLVLAV